MIKNKGPFSHIFPNIKDWQIHQLHADRSNFVKEINEEVFNRFKNKSSEEISKIIAKVIYNERIRIKEEPWKVDPPNEKAFLKKISKKLVLDQYDEAAKMTNLEILKEIVNQYSEEVVSTFEEGTFQFARKFLRVFFGRLLNTAANRNWRRFTSSKHRLYEKLKVYGAAEEVRALSKIGTVVFVPTHFSNLDSVMIGYIMDQIVGIPFPSFGAGLNLYNTGYTAYFMNRLGAYRIDRRKKNPVYLETLKAMSQLSIQRGTSMLFFPGGTRSRSGALETRLKMGMLGTALAAQRANYQNGKKEKIFIVPVILGYHFVLEAKFLIEQHLKKTGKEMYFKTSKDDSYSFRKTMKFIWNTFSASSDINLSLGKPMDVLGNFVDKNGESKDANGQDLNLEEYFYTDGVVVQNKQREQEYTKQLATKIVDRYFKDNLVLSSHLVAFVAFNILLAQHPNLDIYGILRLPPEEYVFSKKSMISAITQLREILFEKEKNDEIHLSEGIYREVEDLLTVGVSKLGAYHSDRPLKMNKKGEIISEDFKILYFYHNRLSNYGFEKAIKWKAFRVGNS